MRRTLTLSALAFAFAGFATASANTTTFTATLETPKTAETQVVLGNYLWTCEGETCTTAMKRKKATVRTCEKLAQEVGKFVAFKSETNTLSDEQVAKCNKAAK